MEERMQREDEGEEDEKSSHMLGSYFVLGRVRCFLISMDHGGYIRHRGR